MTEFEMIMARRRQLVDGQCASITIGTIPTDNDDISIPKICTPYSNDNNVTCNIIDTSETCISSTKLELAAPGTSSSSSSTSVQQKVMNYSELTCNSTLRSMLLQDRTNLTETKKDALLTNQSAKSFTVNNCIEASYPNDSSVENRATMLDEDNPKLVQLPDGHSLINKEILSDPNEGNEREGSESYNSCQNEISEESMEGLNCSCTSDDIIPSSSDLEAENFCSNEYLSLSLQERTYAKSPICRTRRRSSIQYEDIEKEISYEKPLDHNDLETKHLTRKNMSRTKKVLQRSNSVKVVGSKEGEDTVMIGMKNDKKSTTRRSSLCMIPINDRESSKKCTKGKKSIENSKALRRSSLQMVPNVSFSSCSSNSYESFSHREKLPMDKTTSSFLTEPEETKQLQATKQKKSGKTQKYNAVDLQGQSFIDLLVAKSKEIHEAKSNSKFLFDFTEQPALTVPKEKSRSTRKHKKSSPSNNAENVLLKDRLDEMDLTFGKHKRKSKNTRVKTLEDHLNLHTSIHESNRKEENKSQKRRGSTGTILN